MQKDFYDLFVVFEKVCFYLRMFLLLQETREFLLAFYFSALLLFELVAWIDTLPIME